MLNSWSITTLELCFFTYPHVFGWMEMSDPHTSKISLLSYNYLVLSYSGRLSKEREEMVTTSSLFLYNNFVKKSFLAWQNFPMALGQLHIAIYNFSPAWNNFPHATLVNDWDTPWWCLTFNNARAPRLPNNLLHLPYLKGLLIFLQRQKSFKPIVSLGYKFTEI